MCVVVCLGDRYFGDFAFGYYILPRGRQHRDKWQVLAGGLLRDYPQTGNGGLVPDFDLLPHPPGSIWHTPLPEARRRGTRVENIIHAIGPKNDSEFTADSSKAEARERASAIVCRMTARILRLAQDELGANTVVLSGISTGIFSSGDTLWAAEMYAAMRSAISAHVLSPSGNGGQRDLKVVLLGSWQDNG